MRSAFRSPEGRAPSAQGEALGMADHNVTSPKGRTAVNGILPPLQGGPLRLAHHDPGLRPGLVSRIPSGCRSATGADRERGLHAIVAGREPSFARRDRTPFGVPRAQRGGAGQRAGPPRIVAGREPSLHKRSHPFGVTEAQQAPTERGPPRIVARSGAVACTRDRDEVRVPEPRRGGTPSAQGEALGMADHNVTSSEGALARKRRGIEPRSTESSAVEEQFAQLIQPSSARADVLPQGMTRLRYFLGTIVKPTRHLVSPWPD